jgi:long-chain acyl-CoA synthetase
MNPLIAALGKRAADDVVIDDTVRVITAGQLLDDVAELRAALSSFGIDRLGLLAGNSAAWVTADLACQSVGICLLPLPVFFADTQLIHSMESVGIDAVLTDDPLRLRTMLGLQKVADESCQDNSELADFERRFGLTLLRLDLQTRPELPTGTQKITFTSGSTGTPRGVCLGSEQQIAVAQALDTALQLKAPRHLCLLPLSTLLENVGGLYYPLLTGGSVSVPPETNTGFSGSTGLDMLCLLQALYQHRPTSIILLPQMLVGLVAALEEGWQPPAELRFAAVGGAKVSATLIRRARQFGLPVYEGYGLSETASVACMNYPGQEQIGSVGRPLAHVDVSTNSGEVIVAGNAFLGYVGDPASWGAASVATGDLGELDTEGFLHLQGRRKNVLISSFGRNISPEWVESELLLHPELSQCIVLGDARPYCSALVVPADPNVDDMQVQQLLDDVNAKLPDYARVKRWHRLARPLDHATGLYTENGRPRRAAIDEYFAAEIAALYREPVTRVSVGRASATSHADPVRPVSL